MTQQTLAISYDVAALPGVDPHDRSAALGFRIEAMEVMENALTTAGAGEWQGVGMGHDPRTGALEIGFGFTVRDGRAAEALLRATVDGTRYAGFAAKVQRVA